MIRFIFDIETIPADESITIEEEKREKYSLNKKYARVLCIGYIKIVFEQDSKELIQGNEPEILRKFWSISKDVGVFIGHNIYEFDLPFILHRSNVNNIEPLKKLRFFSYRSEREHMYDTQLEAKKMYGRYIRLADLAELLGVEPLRTKLDGSEVYSYHKNGLDNIIYDYCMEQVEQTLKISEKMNLSE